MLVHPGELVFPLHWRRVQFGVSKKGRPKFYRGEWQVFNDHDPEYKSPIAHIRIDSTLGLFIMRDDDPPPDQLDEAYRYRDGKTRLRTYYYVVRAFGMRTQVPTLDACARAIPAMHRRAWRRSLAWDARERLGDTRPPADYR